MRTFKILNGDLVFSDGDFTELTGLDALTQIIQNRLKLWRNEWFAAPDSGIDYFSLFQEKQLLQQKARKAIRDAILADTRIIKINELDITFDNVTRTMACTFSADSSEGLINGSI